MKDDIADDLEWPLTVISATENSFVVCISKCTKSVIMVRRQHREQLFLLSHVITSFMWSWASEHDLIATAKFLMSSFLFPVKFVILLASHLGWREDRTHDRSEQDVRNLRKHTANGEQHLFHVPCLSDACVLWDYESMAASHRDPFRIKQPSNVATCCRVATHT